MSIAKYIILLVSALCFFSFRQTEITEFKEKIQLRQKIDKSEMKKWFKKDLTGFEDVFYGSGRLLDVDSSFIGLVQGRKADTLYEFLILYNHKTSKISTDVIPASSLKLIDDSYRKKYELGDFWLKYAGKDSLNCIQVYKVKFEPTLVDTFQRQYITTMFQRKELEMKMYCYD